MHDTVHRRVAEAVASWAITAAHDDPPPDGRQVLMQGADYARARYLAYLAELDWRPCSECGDPSLPPERFRVLAHNALDGAEADVRWASDLMRRFEPDVSKWHRRG
jgi:hypothetical protein